MISKENFIEQFAVKGKQICWQQCGVVRWGGGKTLHLISEWDIPQLNLEVLVCGRKMKGEGCFFSSCLSVCLHWSSSVPEILTNVSWPLWCDDLRWSMTFGQYHEWTLLEYQPPTCTQQPWADGLVDPDVFHSHFFLIVFFPLSCSLWRDLARLNR